MRDTALAAIDDLLLDGRLTAATAAAGMWAADGRTTEPALRRLAAGVFALAGRTHALAATLDPRLLAGRDASAIETYLSELAGGARSHDYLTAGVALGWSGSPPEVCRYLLMAHELAMTEGRIGFALGALERLTHHALIFGDVAPARSAIADALALATGRDLPYWRARCGAIAARLASDAGDDESARQFIARDSIDAPGDMAALFAPTATYLATIAEDRNPPNASISSEMLDTALYCDAADVAIAAATACLMSAVPNALPALVEAALKRTLMQAEDAMVAPEFFSLVARCGSANEAAFAADALRASAPANRRYLQAHRLLAEAHVEFRFGERAVAIDRASDAARAFDALGLPRWTKEAMLLLVHRDGGPDPAARRRPTALALTDREQQVAHLIRRGASNREVAHTLQISEHTVERHVSSILSRLGLRSRWQMVDVRKVDSRG
jgi:ATP/maltotriose-dependent transcriptional regulator MalT